MNFVQVQSKVQSNQQKADTKISARTVELHLNFYFVTIKKF
jgi:hypothetical protein